jgi:type IV pilus assembly protein PilA
MLARLRKAAEEREGGFTLIELLVVIIIIGILAAIAIPVFLNQRQKGYDAQAKSDLRNAATAEETYMTDATKYSTDVSSATGHDVVYKKSANVGAIVAVMTNASGAKVTGVTNGTDGFCLAARSDSGKWFAYNSVKGGLQSTTYADAATACP